MRILKLSVSNFQSYRHLEFDFAGQGLSGVFGTTGAGKSTLLDAVVWCLYGITSKGVNSDGVKTWDLEDETAEGEIHIHSTDRRDLVIYRRRGGAGKNDLYWSERENEASELSVPFRGKDLKDTQKKLEERLGVSAELFLMSAYMTQFSEADAFFIASAKDRRAVLEKIADQEFAIKLGERTSDLRKVAKKNLDELNLMKAKSEGAVESLKKSLAHTTAQAADWENKHTFAVEEVERKCFSYAAESAKKSAEWDKQRGATLEGLMSQINDLPDPPGAAHYDAEIAKLKAESRCPTCSALSDKHSEHIARLREQKIKSIHVHSQLAKLTTEYTKVSNEKNPYEPGENPYEGHLRTLKGAANPFSPNLENYRSEISRLESHISEIQDDIDSLLGRVANLTWLYDKSFELRGLMMDRVVRQVEERSNYYLERFFDGALRVQLRCEGADKIGVVIHNDGHECSFPALSGGERCMLKLAFTLSIMRAAQNKAGVSINCIMLDEPLNGLPEDLKVKAFGLFEELTKEFETVLVIDHSPAFQNCFSSTFFIDKSSGYSVLSY